MSPSSLSGAAIPVLLHLRSCHLPVLVLFLSWPSLTPRRLVLPPFEKILSFGCLPLTSPITVNLGVNYILSPLER